MRNRAEPGSSEVEFQVNSRVEFGCRVIVFLVTIMMKKKLPGLRKLKKKIQKK
jgi:hypothetical protein